MSEAQYKVISMLMGVLLVASMLFVGREAAVFANSTSIIQATQTTQTPCVVIDAGHGGFDPGKVGVGGVLEKDLNLTIALLVQNYLEANDISVVMTRTTDESLGDSASSNKKVEDMKERVAIIDENTPMLAVSIHQNSYIEEYVHGAQVFYFTQSAKGKELADTIQKSIVERVDPNNTRPIKANDSYYLLKRTDTPIVIVECGFLTNYDETALLNDPVYQDQMAWAISMGILQYISSGAQ
ncbi:MAG: N-acetylmuramoyl-L-alanine amidase [Clostridium sp.]|nr:N-acetylmuramoyl-L-alanine amidase [Clostridium sp.]